MWAVFAARSPQADDEFKAEEIKKVPRPLPAVRCGNFHGPSRQWWYIEQATQQDLRQMARGSVCVAKLETDFLQTSTCIRASGMWEFPKIGDPNIVPEIVGSL